MALKYESVGATRGGTNFMATCTTLAVLASQSSPPVITDIYSSPGTLNATNVLAHATLTSASFTVTGAAGATQTCTVAQQSSVVIGPASGTAVVVALTDGTDFIMTTISGTPQSLTNNGSNTVTIQQFSKAISQPT